MIHFYKKILVIIALLLTNLAIISSSVKAQWSIPGTSAGDTVVGYCMTSIGNTLISGKQGIAYSTNFGAHWVITFQGLPYSTWLPDYSKSLYTKGNEVFLGIDVNGTPPGSVGVYKSLDSGKSWFPSAAGMVEGTPVYCFITKDNLIFAGTDDGVYVSSNSGQNWTKPSTFLDEKTISCFCVNGNTLFLGILGSTATNGLGVYASTNNGATWTAVNYGFPAFTTIFSMVNYNGYIYGTSYDGQVFRTTNNGALWSLVNNGIPNFYNPVYAIAKFNNNLIVGCNEGIYITTNQGQLWYPINQGIPTGSQFQFNAITKCGNYVFAPANNGIYRRDLNQVGVQNISSIVSDSYILSQNYPNPFNPTTKIKFELPKSSFVSLKVYNSAGKEIEFLVNEKLGAGVYEETFNAEKLSSGIYFYKITTDDFVQTKKMLLVK
ncbi:MAG: T9SS type A sorting domain-containing protein [Bacteroidetes bacterium]|nr:T9SS type A sorting domain-containing protein [Bacteroidota bacterium]